jgi:hypothetical protein
VVSRILIQPSWISDDRTRKSPQVLDPVNIMDAVPTGLACSRFLPERFLTCVPENCLYESQKAFASFREKQASKNLKARQDVINEV